MRNVRHSSLSVDFAWPIYLVTLGCVTLEIFRIPAAGLTWSVFRIGVLLLLGLVAARVLVRGSIHNPLVVALAVPYLMSVAWASLAAEATAEWWAGLLNNGLALAVLVVSSQMVTGLRRAAAAQAVLAVTSAASFTLFALYSYTHFWRVGQPVREVPFVQHLPMFVSRAEHLEHGGVIWGSVENLPRLSLPLLSAPHLAVCAVLASFFALCCLVVSRRRIARAGFALVAVLLAAVTIGTISRSGLLLMAVGSLLFVALLARRLSPGMVLVPVGVVVAGLVFSQVFHTGAIVSRLTEVQGESTTHHIESRVEAVDLAHGSPTVASFGVGLGRYEDIVGVEHSHSDYTTVLVERGILGSLLFWLPALASLVRLFDLGRRAVGDGEVIVKTAMIALFLVLAGSLIYQIGQLPLVQVVVALAHVVAWGTPGRQAVEGHRGSEP
jgi:hypothetical protein